jgi:hypothetical protein
MRPYALLGDVNAIRFTVVTRLPLRFMLINLNLWQLFWLK